MKHLRLAEMDRKEASRQAVETLRAGGIVLYPTDTVYGLGCDPFSESALRRLTALKRREESHAYLVLVRSPEAVTPLVSRVPELFSFFSKRLWPGPVTLIFDKDRGCRPFPGSDSIAIRCPRWRFLRDFLQMLETPLISTSANLSGEAPAQDPVKAARQLEEEVDLLLDFGILVTGHPSTILDIRSDPPRILREGAMLGRVLDAITDWQALRKADPDRR